MPVRESRARMCKEKVKAAGQDEEEEEEEEDEEEDGDEGDEVQSVAKESILKKREIV
jgi:hypothetical protein